MQMPDDQTATPPTTRGARGRSSAGRSGRSGTGRTIAAIVWFPLFFCAGFLCFYFVPFHKVAPHDLPVAVVGLRLGSKLSHQFADRAPGSFHFVTVSDAATGRSDLLDRHVYGVIDLSPHSATLYLAGANGSALRQVLEKAFAPVARSVHAPLRTVDVAPLEKGDTTGTGFFYVTLLFDLVSYVLVMFTIQKPHFGRTRSLALMTVFGAVLSAVVWPVAWTSGVLPVNPAVIPLSFLLTQAIAWVGYGLVPLARRAVPAVLLLLFILLSIPSSGGVVPVALVPRFYQVFQPLMPLGVFVSAARGILYFHDHALLQPILTLSAWLAVGIGLVTYTGLRIRRAGQKRHDAERGATASIEVSAELPPSPATRGRDRPDMTAAGGDEWVIVYGSVFDDAGRAVRAGTVTATTAEGHPLTRADVREDGSYATLLPVGAGTIVVITAFGAERGVGATPVGIPGGQRRVRAEVHLVALVHRQLSEERYNAASAAAAAALGGTF